MTANTTALLAAALTLLLTSGCQIAAESTAPPPQSASGQAAAIFTYDGWNAALQHVDDRGLVDYAALAADPSALRNFYGALAGLDAETFGAWSDGDQIAFWINAYNALTVLAIIERWPLERSGLGALAHPRGIRWLSGVWDKLEWTVMGKTITLDGIEHGTLRKEFEEPRIHAALVCAAMSCPPLSNDVYEGARLDAQLDEQMRRWVNNSETGMRIDQAAGKVLVSKIFDWYGEDFVATDLPAAGYGEASDKERASIAAAARYREAEDRAFLESGAYNVGYLDYDWSLNEQPSP